MSPRIGLGPLVLLAVFAGCSQVNTDSGSSIAGGSGAVDGEMAVVDVVRVLDGDSMVIVIDGQEETARLLGINAPERDECLADDARARLEDLTGNNPSIAGEKRDQFGRLLVWVVANGVAVNERMVGEGLAIAVSVPPPQDDLLHAAQEEAAASQLGVWSAESCEGGPIASLQVVRVEANPPGPDDENLDGEIVTIENVGHEPLDLEGFVLRDESTANRYVFGPMELSPGTRIEISSGCDPSGAVLTWCADGPVWNNDGDTAFIFDPAGRAVSGLRT